MISIIFDVDTYFSRYLEYFQNVIFILRTSQIFIDYIDF